MHTHSALHNDATEATVPISRGTPAVVSVTIDTSLPKAALVEETAYVELDLDVVPSPGKRAVEVEGNDDPAVQALALAATRAEVSRLTRAEEELQRAVRLRDGWLNTARAELKAAEDERRTLESQLRDAQHQMQEMSELIARLRIDLDALRAAEPASGQYEPPTEFDPDHPPRLEPVGHDGPAVLLDRKVITVGRTSDSDLCVPSPLVSRDHARLLVSGNSVTLVDVGSVNGCFVNHRQVKKQVLREGDVLRIADRAFRVSLAA
ncbi:MAG: FHA domain-containing protein [Steroidobacteraceae bacterium]